MASVTLSLSGESSELSANYFPPIKLDPNAEYVCGLTEFQTFNSIPNINSHNNRLHYLKKGSISLLPGYYRVNRIIELILETYLTEYDINADNFLDFMIFDIKQIENRRVNPDMPNQYLSVEDLEEADDLNLNYYRGSDDFTLDNVDYDTFYAIGNLTTTDKVTLVCEYISYIEIPVGTYEMDAIVAALDKALTAIDDHYYIQVEVNKNSLTSHIKSNVFIDFTQKKSIGSVLGFKANRVLRPNIANQSDGVVKISGLNTIRLECNITSGSYANEASIHSIHEFYPSVPVGYKIIEVPRNVIYLPLITSTINNLTIRIVDQDNKLLDFRGEKISLRLHIKKL
jgi:hypothetical protein